jgi:hypothetical protein
MTEQEFQALLSLLNRAPITPAEALWLNELLTRLRPQPKQPDTKGV